MSRITAVCLCMAAVTLLLQPASCFPLERTTISTGVAGMDSNLCSLNMEPAQYQSVVLSHHAHDSSEQDAVDSRQQQQQQQQKRRQVLQTLGLSTLSLPFWGLATARAAGAADQIDPSATAADTSRTFYRRKDQYGYQFTPPPNFTPGNKPLKTHLDENNFKSSDVSGFQFGITVDPVRLQSLAEFGTPGEVAAKVVTAEVNRDGVFDVKLMDDPIEQRGDNSNNGSDTEGTSNGLVLDYLSSGKRGDKRFVAKLFVEKGKLYVLTAQCKQADYETVKKELLEAVDSFRVLPVAVK